MSGSKIWGVFPFSMGGKSDSTRGHVVRECFADGRAVDTYNYGGVLAVKIYKRRSSADRHAETLTYGFVDAS
jgi:hypothetical protein